MCLCVVAGNRGAGQMILVYGVFVRYLPYVRICCSGAFVARKTIIGLNNVYYKKYVRCHITFQMSCSGVNGGAPVSHNDRLRAILLARTHAQTLSL